MASTASSSKNVAEQNSLKGFKESLKPDQGVRDHLLPYTDPRGMPTESNQDWDEGRESFFGGEHTLILIICLSAIATMLVLILFIILAWMRRRSLLAASRRGTNPNIGPMQQRLKTMFVEGVPRDANLSSPTGWGNYKVEDTSTKRGSPVYWLKATAGSKGTINEKNVREFI